MGALNVIIDGNYHMHRSMHTYEQKADVKLSTEEDRAVFLRKLAIDVASVIRTIGSPSRVIWTIDNNSWRKTVEIDQNDGYKKNRVYKDDTDWNSFRELNYEFGKILKDHNCICSCIDGFEGDDLMYFWSEKLYNDGEDVILVTGDKDITQLVKCNGKNFICVLNSNSLNRKIVGSVGFEDYVNSEDEIGLFNLDAFSNNKKVIKDMVASKISIEEINPNDVVFEKIVAGDDGDNVPPIVTWQETQKSGKVVNRKITEKKAQSIREDILASRGDCDIFNLDMYAKDFVKGIDSYMNQKVEEKLIADRLKRNTRLVWLNEAVLPEDFSGKFAMHVRENDGYGKPNVSQWRMQDLLEGTKYYEDRGMSVESDVFKTSYKKRAKSKKDVTVEQLYKTLF